MASFITIKKIFYYYITQYMKLQSKSIKILLSLLVISLFSFNQIQIMQLEKKNFLDKFPILAKKINNQELRKLIETAPNIKYEYQTEIKNTIFETESELIPIGKVETKKAIILIYAEVKEAYQEDKRLMYIHSFSVDKKDGKMIEGSEEKYLTSTGELGHKKETYTGEIEFDGEKIIFTSQTINQDNKKVKERESVTYLIGKKMLEFDKRE